MYVCLAGASFLKQVSQLCSQVQFTFLTLYKENIGGRIKIINILENRLKKQYLKNEREYLEFIEC